MTAELFVEERHRLILENLRRDGRVSVKHLSDTMAVSAVTIRSDLRVLEESGQLKRTYGGAVAVTNEVVTPDLSFEVRQRSHHAEKDAIARAAARRVEDGFAVMLDASTTAFALIPYLKQRQRLIVVTNGLMVAHSLLDSPHITVLLPSGRLRRDSISLVGAPDKLPDVHINIGFFGTRGISAQTGITDSDPDEAAMKRAMIEHCVSVCVVAHHDKLEKVAPFAFARLERVRTIFTTRQANSDAVANYRAHGVEVELVGTTRGR
ncbi:MAG: DeoR/GlpR transcriptional regulator [Chloroflexi bacterium]|nr:DeoR/GlpR transcriptional regulator [Chloroflexota bacterium]